MEEEKQLYPLVFCNLQDDYAWGSEKFGVADLGYRDSLVKSGWLAGNSLGEIMDTYLDRVVGDNVFEYYGRQFPIEVKYLNVDGKMPLVVHPDDTLAEQRYDFLGKEKLWYIVSAGPDATVSIGFQKDCDASVFYNSCLDGSVRGLLNTVAPHAGQVFHIGPGTVHCASGHILIAEISESSPLDFCLYSWGEEVSDEEFDRSLDLASALDFIDFGAFRPDSAGVRDGGAIENLVSLKQFTVNRMTLTDPLRIDAGKFGSFTVYTCVSGEMSVQVNTEDNKGDYVVAEGGSVLIPAECTEFFVAPRKKNTVVLEAVVEHRDDDDPYINKDAYPHLPDA